MRPARIVIVEDEAVLRLDLQDRLEALGYDVVETGETFADALRVVEATRPDLVFMDIRLKGDRDGISAARGIREKFGTPVVFLTAFADVNTLARARETEPFGYLTKPYRDHDLRAAVEIGLHRARAEQDLVAARDEAQDGERATREMLAQVSHEIRTPLGAISGLADLLRSCRSPEALADQLGLIKQSADSLLLLINDLLDLSRLDAGKTLLDAAPFSLHDLLEQPLRLLADSAHRKGLEFVADVAADLPETLLGDPGRLRQVLVNLLGNAVKFTNAGGVLLEVRRGSAVAGGVTLAVAVRDTGIGLSAEQIKVIFDPFTQADPGIAGRFGGSGLGLSIASRLLGLMGSRLEVSSEPGRGAVFSFAVALGVPEGRPPAAMTRVPRRVVLADGSALGGPLVARMLADTGAVVTHAKDAGALLSAVADSPPSLAVIDLESLGGSDVAFADALASMGYEGLVVFLTRSSTFRSAVAGSRTLPKPVLPRSLAAAVERRDPAGPPDVLDGPRLRFLLAEDDEINQLLAVSALEKAGHAVEVVSTGTDAVRRAVEGAFDVVLMDVHLPHLSGPDATREIRRLRAGSERPLAVVALTAAGEGSGDRERCLAAGMNAFATKPLNLASLRKILDALGVG